MTLRRRLNRLDARAPDLRLARLASMTDAELADCIGRDAARDMADPEATIAELRAEIETMT